MFGREMTQIATSKQNVKEKATPPLLMYMQLGNYQLNINSLMISCYKKLQYKSNNLSNSRCKGWSWWR